MSNKTIEKCISNLTNDDKLLDGVLKWIVDKGYSKKFKKCTDNACDECEKVGLTKDFHGRSCYQCNLFNVRQRYGERVSKKKKSTK